MQVSDAKLPVDVEADACQFHRHVGPQALVPDRSDRVGDGLGRGDGLGLLVGVGTDVVQARPDAPVVEFADDLQPGPKVFTRDETPGDVMNGVLTTVRRTSGRRAT